MSQGHLTAHLTAPRTRSSTFLACCIGGLLFAVPPLEAADLLSGTWTSGEGADTLTYVFKVIGGQFTGIVCGRCDDPDAVFEIEDGRIVDPGRATFVIRQDAAERAGQQVAAYRERVEASLARNAMTLLVRLDSNAKATTVSRSLTRVVPNYELSAFPLPSSAGASVTASLPFKAGHWVSAGRVAQQNWILKVRDNRIWGVVCGPCTPAVVTMVDGLVAGDTITFDINHIDTPPDAARQGIQRNVMSGTIGTGDNANVMRFKWVSEGRPDRSGEIVMFGPLR